MATHPNVKIMVTQPDIYHQHLYPPRRDGPSLLRRSESRAAQVCVPAIGKQPKHPPPPHGLAEASLPQHVSHFPQAVLGGQTRPPGDVEKHPLLATKQDPFLVTVKPSVQDEGLENQK